MALIGKKERENILEKKEEEEYMPLVNYQMLENKEACGVCS